MSQQPILESMLTCPECGFARSEMMPTDACQYYYECTKCRTLLRPKPGDCCVFVHSAPSNARRFKRTGPVAARDQFLRWKQWKVL